ncbi:unnamed protein product [Coregonus sp. 'balchen']|nr:unnamed protein product [Coregonus sp. 'balchen']
MLFRGVTAHCISKTNTLYLNETASPSPGPPHGPPSALNDAAGTPPALTPRPTKPLLLMIPWLGSRPQAVAKYCEIYFRKGLDVFIVASELLWPCWGLDYGARVLDVLQSDRFVSRPLLVHTFSIGGTPLPSYLCTCPTTHGSTTAKLRGSEATSMTA